MTVVLVLVTFAGFLLVDHLKSGYDARHHRH